MDSSCEFPQHSTLNTVCQPPGLGKLLCPKSIRYHFFIGYREFMRTLRRKI